MSQTTTTTTLGRDNAEKGGKHDGSEGRTHSFECDYWYVGLGAEVSVV